MNEERSSVPAAPLTDDRRAPVLLLAEQADLINALIADAAEPDAHPQIGVFLFDGSQSYRVEDAQAALARGFERRPYLVMVVAGDIAATMTPRDLEETRKKSLSPSELVIVGLGDTDEQRARLAQLGIRRVFPSLTFRKDFPVQVKAAVEDRRIEREQLAAAATIKGAPINITINVAPKGGLLRDGGVIAVHSTKGGTGKTTIATNIAWALAAAGRSTVLADLNVDGALSHLHLWKYVMEVEGIKSVEELFEVRGISALARKIRTDVTHNMIPPQELEAALVKLNENLWLLPGFRDQADYRVGEAGADRSVANLLSNRRWVEVLLSQLRRADGGRSFVVVDLGTGRYTAPGFTSLTQADLLILVVNAKMPANVAADLQSARELVEGGAITLMGKRMIIANQLQRDVPGAPTLAEIQKAFEFFGADRIIPVHEAGPELISANVRGIPYLSERRNLSTPLGADLIAVVNAISNSYVLPESEKPEKSGGFHFPFGKKKKGA